jgi:hypothetical protein
LISLSPHADHSEHLIHQRRGLNPQNTNSVRLQGKVKGMTGLLIGKTLRPPLPLTGMNYPLIERISLPALLKRKRPTTSPDPIDMPCLLILTDGSYQCEPKWKR